MLNYDHITKPMQVKFHNMLKERFIVDEDVKRLDPNIIDLPQMQTIEKRRIKPLAKKDPLHATLVKAVKAANAYFSIAWHHLNYDIDRQKWIFVKRRPVNYDIKDVMSAHLKIADREIPNMRDRDRRFRGAELLGITFTDGKKIYYLTKESPDPADEEYEYESEAAATS